MKFQSRKKEKSTDVLVWGYVDVTPTFNLEPLTFKCSRVLLSTIEMFISLLISLTRGELSCFVQCSVILVGWLGDANYEDLQMKLLVTTYTCKHICLSGNICVSAIKTRNY